MEGLLAHLPLAGLVIADVGRDAAQRVDITGFIAQRQLDGEEGLRLLARPSQIDFLGAHDLALVQHHPVIPADLVQRLGIEEARVGLADDLLQRCTEHFAGIAVGEQVAPLGIFQEDMRIDVVEDGRQLVLGLAQFALALGDHMQEPVEASDQPADLVAAPDLQRL